MAKNTSNNLNLRTVYSNGEMIFEIQNIQEVNKRINNSIKKKINDEFLSNKETVNLMPKNNLIEFEHHLINGNSIILQ